MLQLYYLFFLCSVIEGWSQKIKKDATAGLSPFFIEDERKMNGPVNELLNRWMEEKEESKVKPSNSNSHLKQSFSTSDHINFMLHCFNHSCLVQIISLWVVAYYRWDLFIFFCSGKCYTYCWYWQWRGKRFYTLFFTLRSSKVAYK